MPKYTNIPFSTNLEFVQRAREILERPGYEPCVVNGRCRYRINRGTEEEQRCVVGELFFGKVNEEDPVWDSSKSAANTKVFFEKAPFLDRRIVQAVQDKHDDVTRVYSLAVTWNEIKSLAMAIDEDAAA